VKWIEWQTKTGEAVTAGGLTVRPQSRALIVRLPFGGIVWNRPTAVLVQQGEETEEIMIPDITRLVQFALMVAAVSFLFVVWMVNRSVMRET
jgi:hypothetical protein